MIVHEVCKSKWILCANKLATNHDETGGDGLLVVMAGNLIVENLRDNRLVLSWCHRSVALVASRRYRREIDDIKTAHHDISCLLHRHVSHRFFFPIVHKYLELSNVMN